MFKILLNIREYFWPRTTIGKLAKLHRSGRCHKEQLGYMCHGRNNYRECM